MLLGDLGMLAGLLDVVDAAILSLSNVAIGSSVAALEKQEIKGSALCATVLSSALSEASGDPAVKGSTSASLPCEPDVSTTALLVALADRISSKVPIAAASISLNRCDIAASYSPRSMLGSCSSI